MALVAQARSWDRRAVTDIGVGWEQTGLEEIQDRAACVEEADVRPLVLFAGFCVKVLLCWDEATARRQVVECWS